MPLPGSTPLPEPEMVPSPAASGADIAKNGTAVQPAEIPIVANGVWVESPVSLARGSRCPAVPALRNGTAGHCAHSVEFPRFLLSHAQRQRGTLGARLSRRREPFLSCSELREQGRVDRCYLPPCLPPFSASKAFLIRWTAERDMPVSSAMSRILSPPSSRAFTRA